MTNTVIAAQKSDDVLEYLAKRRSVPVKNLAAPGPSGVQLDQMLQIAMRVPDHGKLAPWYFVVIQGEARAQLGVIARDIYTTKKPDATAEELAIEANRFMRAPVVVAVISRRREGKSPWFEQILSAGAACYNLTLAAHASGFGAVWLTEWVAFNNEFKQALGADTTRDHVAGLIYIGSMVECPIERDRPDPTKIVTHWQPGVKPNTGDEYDRVGFGFAANGF